MLDEGLQRYQGKLARQNGECDAVGYGLNTEDTHLNTERGDMMPSRTIRLETF